MGTKYNHLPTSDPVKIAGSLATNWEAVVESDDNFVNKPFTDPTISSCLTAPEATTTWNRTKDHSWDNFYIQI